MSKQNLNIYSTVLALIILICAPLLSPESFDTFLVSMWFFLILGLIWLLVVIANDKDFN